MLAPYIIYAAIVILAGASGLCLRPKGFAGKYLPAAVISLASLLAIIYLLLTFPRIDPLAVITFINSQLPFSGIAVGLDSLSAFFLIPLLILATTCSFYGPRYFKDHPAHRSHWFFFGLLVCGMVMVLLARNVMLFILSWEVMSLSSFFLVITDNKKPEIIRAGWIYFITAHVGTAFLLTLFFFLASLSGSFDFAAWRNIGFSTTQANIIFTLALVAFGFKAGFIPFHIWLPQAHPSAPSHISALMSGIMIKMGIYGILRALTFVTPYHAWWGGLLIFIGAVSGILGVLFAIGQHDMKRLLAYHSVENIGIILLGIGIGIIGTTSGIQVMALFGFAGALLHVLNHALFKGLLFLGAGAVIRQTSTSNIDTLGGLVKQMPKTAVFFLIGSAAICGLPFFNGFISELFVYSASIAGAVQIPKPALALIGLAVIASLALIGGLAAACFTKVFGVVFLGERRDQLGDTPKGEVPVQMWLPMAFLAFLCVVIGLGSPLLPPYLAQPVLLFTGQVVSTVRPLYALTSTISLVMGLFLIGAAGITFMVILFRLKKNRAARGVTWDCGYIAPRSSMQYTASSFAAPIVSHFKSTLSAHNKLSSDGKFFPGNTWSFHSSVEDWFLSVFYTPMIGFFDRLFSSLRWFQSGKVGQYVLYIAATICCLIIWKFFL